MLETKILGAEQRHVDRVKITQQDNLFSQKKGWGITGQASILGQASVPGQSSEHTGAGSVPGFYSNAGGDCLFPIG